MSKHESFENHPMSVWGTVVALVVVTAFVTIIAVKPRTPVYATHIFVDGAPADSSVTDCEYGVAYNFNRIAMVRPDGTPLTSIIRAHLRLGYMSPELLDRRRSAYTSVLARANELYSNYEEIYQAF
jgi:hypothetical protein